MKLTYNRPGCARRIAVQRVCAAQPRAAPIAGAAQTRSHALKCAVVGAAAMATLMLPLTADAISGGKESMGIFVPLDDADLSGKNLTQISFVKAALRRVKFDDADLSGTTMFGAFCKDCSFVRANLTNTNLESTELEGANFNDAVLVGAQVTNARFGNNTLENSDWTDVLLRKDQLRYLCSIAAGTNTKTGVDTRESLNCP